MKGVEFVIDEGGRKRPCSSISKGTERFGRIFSIRCGQKSARVNRLNRLMKLRRKSLDVRKCHCIR